MPIHACPGGAGLAAPCAYRFAPARRIRTNGGALEVWAALDALVLKAVAIVLTRRLAARLSVHCYHVAGHGGAKAAVWAVAANPAANTFVLCTDVRSYYGSIDLDVLFDLVHRLISDPCVLDLIRQYLYRTVYEDGFYRDVRRGICLGCPLSPLMGALYLRAMD